MTKPTVVLDAEPGAESEFPSGADRAAAPGARVALERSPTRPTTFDASRRDGLMMRDPHAGCERIIVFTRYPEPGAAKTRLIPTLGAEASARLQRDMTSRLLALADSLCREREVKLEVRFTGGEERRMAAIFGGHRTYRPQGEGDLGERMRRAIRHAFAESVEGVVVVGTDCPGLDRSVLAAALDALRAHDVVLGPATDGGYYLIGLRADQPNLFRGIDWGTDRVLAQTLARLLRARRTCHLLAPLSDVDRPEDLPLWERTAARASDTVPPRLSVIIPTLNEEMCIDSTLDSIRRSGDVEVIVVDGGSQDRTVEFAARQGVIVAHSLPGRGRQMNVGAAIATGDVLLFLHADTRLPAGYLQMIEASLGSPAACAGAFPLCIAAPGRSFRVIEFLVALRSRWLGMPYGDQAIFVTKHDFHLAGGFPEIPILEDYVLMRRLRRLGRIAMAARPVATSAQRWLAKGVLRTTLLNQACLLAYRMGFRRSASHGGERR